MASNLKRSKKTIGHAFNDTSKRVSQLQKRSAARRIAPGVVTPTNFSPAITTNLNNIDAAASGAQSTADGKNSIFYTSSVPTANKAGDLWFDTDDNFKLYRALSDTANEITPGEWQLAVVNGTNITAGTIDASQVTVSNIDAGRITAGTLSVTGVGGVNAINAGTPVAGLYPFSVSSAGVMRSVSGTIGAFTINNIDLTASSLDTGIFGTTSTISLATNGEIKTRLDGTPIFGPSYYTEVYINKRDDQGGINVQGTASGSLESTRIRSSFIETPVVFVGSTDIRSTTAGFAGSISVSTTASAARTRVGDGSAGTPSISFTNDTNTGLYRYTSGVIGFTTNGTLRARMGTSFLDLSDGPIGITGASSISTTGTLTAGEKLDCNGTVEFDQGAGGSTTAIPQTTQSNVGVLCFQGTTGGVGNQAVYWRSTSFTSSIRYKENINSLADTAASLSQFWDLDPIEFEYKNEHGGAIEKERPYNHRRRFGFIAEDVEEKVPYLVGYDDDSKVDSIKFDGITTLLYAEVRKMRQFMIDNYGYTG